MENAIIEQAVTQGLWAALFVGLLFWILKENAKRESKYQDIIDKLTQKFEHLENGIDYIKAKFDSWGGKPL